MERLLRGLLRLALLDSFASNGASNDIPRNDITYDNYNNKKIMGNLRPIFFLDICGSSCYNKARAVNSAGRVLDF